VASIILGKVIASHLQFSGLNAAVQRTQFKTAFKVRGYVSYVFYFLKNTYVFYFFMRKQNKIRS
jgi:hypothetical protein